MASTSVVFPWSTWAMIAILRMLLKDLLSQTVARRPQELQILDQVLADDVGRTRYDESSLYQYKSPLGVTEVPLFASCARRRMVATFPRGVTSNLGAGPESRVGRPGSRD